MENWRVNTDFWLNKEFQDKSSNSSATIVNYLYFSKMKTTEVVLLYTKSTVLK